MSGYSGRSGVNVSQYLANLNSVPSPTTEESSAPENRDEDFNLFMNTDFFDSHSYDAAAPPTVAADLPALDFALDDGTSQANPTHAAAAPTAAGPADESSKMDFGLGGDFHFADFNFSHPLVDTSLANLPHNVQPFPVSGTFTSPASSAVSPISPSYDLAGSIHKKRKLDGSTDPHSEQSIDEAARVAAEEDKRRRNTAASARFRIKKKQREQALEKTAKDMSDRVSVLEARIQQLETENTWLKGLITEKNGGRASASELVAKLSKHEEGERSSGNRTDGVGTAKRAAA